MSQPQSSQPQSSAASVAPQNSPLLPLALLAYCSFPAGTFKDDPAAQLHQAIQAYERELTRLTAANQSLKAQLNHSGAPAPASEQPAEATPSQTEAATLQTEKMATLGMLMAGVAHEINTPLGAIQASAENLDYSISQTLEGIPKLCRALNEDQLAAFEQLLSWAGQDSGNRSSREERQLKREIQGKLQALELDNARQIAATLSPMGITQELERLLPILQAPEADLILEAAYNLSAIQSNSKNIGIAIDRTNKIVGSLRNYVRKSSQTKPTLSHLHEGLETVLTLYQNKLKHGIEVHKQFAPVPPLLCYPEELDQAWGNLIGNAIQAMEGQGKLEISLTQSNNSLVIRITDSGPGIPEAVQDQIFAPYFTTKPMGQGSGLGLSITHKIISRHNGLIEVDSRPGHTCFQISLPLEVVSQDHHGPPSPNASSSSPAANHSDVTPKLKAEGKTSLPPA